MPDCQYPLTEAEADRELEAFRMMGAPTEKHRCTHDPNHWHLRSVEVEGQQKLA